MNLKTAYYRDMLLAIHRGNSRTGFSNAKPFYILAIIKGIENGFIIGNNIRIDNLSLKDAYYSIFKEYAPNKDVTPLQKPYFHLNSEQFYQLKFKPGTTPPPQAKTPSVKFLREEVEYAALDEQLWDLLQDSVIREEYRQAIIRRFLQ